jgi:hypothetical protein
MVPIGGFVFKNFETAPYHQQHHHHHHHTINSTTTTTTIPSTATATEIQQYSLSLSLCTKYQCRPHRYKRREVVIIVGKVTSNVMVIDRAPVVSLERRNVLNMM